MNWDIVQENGFNNYILVLLLNLSRDLVSINKSLTSPQAKIRHVLIITEYGKKGSSSIPNNDDNTKITFLIELKIK